MAGKQQEPEQTQRTAKGLEIPVPKRSDLMDSFRKIVGQSVNKKGSGDSEPSPPPA